jgi:ATP-dependent DNA helicase RecG
MTRKELEKLLQAGESNKIEFKSRFTKDNKLPQTICAFANNLDGDGKPGYIIIGINNDKTFSGLRDTDQIQTTIAEYRSNANINPLPSIGVQLISCDEGDVLVVKVEPSSTPPLRYEGVVWVRTGSSTRRANPEDERRLSEKRTSLTKTFDAEPCRDASVDDLALRLFDEYRGHAVNSSVIAENHRSTDEKLASLSFFDLKNQCPTYAGILLFGTNIRNFLPGAYVQFLKFPGSDISDQPEDTDEINGDLRTLVDRTYEKIRSHNRVSMAKGERFVEKNVPKYPESSLREFLNNAIIHRDYQSNTPIRFYWYEDRIEISSPGGLYPPVTYDQIERRTGYRNPIVANAMKELGYVEKFGRGIQTAQKALQDNGNPAAEIAREEGFFHVTIYRRKS